MIRIYTMVRARFTQVNGGARKRSSMAVKSDFRVRETLALLQKKILQTRFVALCQIG